MTKPDWTERLLLRMPEVATILGIGRSTVYELVQRGDLPAVHVGRAVRIPSAKLRPFRHHCFGGEPASHAAT